MSVRTVRTYHRKPVRLLSKGPRRERLAPRAQRRPGRAWLATAVATAASTYALDAAATAAGVALAASGAAARRGRGLGCCASSAPRTSSGAPACGRNLRANWALLQRTGTSTNALSKAAHDLAALRGRRPRPAPGARRPATSRPRSPRRRRTTRARSARRCVSDAIAVGDAIVFLGGSEPRRRRVRVRPRARAHLLRSLQWPSRPAATRRSTPTGCRRSTSRTTTPSSSRTRSRRSRTSSTRCADRAGRAGPVLRHRPDAPSRLPRRGHARRRSTWPTTCRRTSRDRALAAARARRARLAPVRRATRSSARASRADHAQLAEREELTRAKVTRLLHADAGDREPVAGRYARSSAPTAPTRRPPTARRGETYMRHISGTWCARAALFVTSALRRFAQLRRRRQALPERGRRRARPAGGAGAGVRLRDRGPRAARARATRLRGHRARQGQSTPTSVGSGSSRTPKRSSTPAAISRASASSSAVVPPPRLVSASVCLEEIAIPSGLP